MPKLKPCDKLFYWHKKPTRIASIALDHQKMKNPKNRRTLTLRKTTSFLLLIVLVEIETNLVKFWVGFPNFFFVQIRKVIKTNSQTS